MAAASAARCADFLTKYPQPRSTASPITPHSAIRLVVIMINACPRLARVGFMSPSVLHGLFGRGREIRHRKIHSGTSSGPEHGQPGLKWIYAANLDIASKGVARIGRPRRIV